MVEEVGQPRRFFQEVGKALAVVVRDVTYQELKPSNLLSVSLPSLIRISFSVNSTMEENANYFQILSYCFFIGQFSLQWVKQLPIFIYV